MEAGVGGSMTGVIGGKVNGAVRLDVNTDEGM